MGQDLRGASRYICDYAARSPPGVCARAGLELSGVVVVSFNDCSPAMIQLDASDHQSRTPIRLLVMGHVRLYREGLAGSLEGGRFVQVVGTAEDYESVLTQISLTMPDVVLLDMTTPEAHGIIGIIRRHAPAARIVAFAVHEDEPQIVGCLESGAAAFVTCESSVEELVTVIQSVARDELVCSPRIAATLGRRLAARASASGSPLDREELTNRERQVLRLIGDGLSNKEIGQQLGIAEATVKNHVHRVLKKLEVTNRRQAWRVTNQPGLRSALG